MFGLDPFVARVTASVVVGGLWIAAATFAAERFGAKVGGLLAGLPATAAVSLFFIALVEGPAVAFDATTAFPLAMATNAFFLVAYLQLTQRGVRTALAGSLLVWCLVQGVLVGLHPTSFGWAMIVWALIVVLAVFLLVGSLRVHSAAGVKLHYSLSQLVGRAVFGGGVVGSAVVLSRLGGALVGAVFSAFPAVYLSTLLITAKTIDLEFSRSIVPALLVSSEINCVAFSVGFRLAVVNMGPLGALGVGYLVSIVAGIGSLLVIRVCFR